MTDGERERERERERESMRERDKKNLRKKSFVGKNIDQ